MIINKIIVIIIITIIIRPFIDNKANVSLAAIHYVHYRSQRCITTPSKPKVDEKYKYHYENA